MIHLYSYISMLFADNSNLHHNIFVAFSNVQLVQIALTNSMYNNIVVIPGGRGYSAKSLVWRLSTSLKNGPNRIWQGSKKGGSIGLEIGKKGVNWIEYQHNEGLIRSSLAVWGLSGCWKGHPIRLKISKTTVITTEPPYHAQVWEYPPPWGRDTPFLRSQILWCSVC